MSAFILFSVRDLEWRKSGNKMKSRFLSSRSKQCARMSKKGLFLCLFLASLGYNFVFRVDSQKILVRKWNVVKQEKHGDSQPSMYLLEIRSFLVFLFWSCYWRRFTMISLKEIKESSRDKLKICLSLVWQICPKLPISATFQKCTQSGCSNKNCLNHAPRYVLVLFCCKFRCSNP